MIFVRSFTLHLYSCCTLKILGVSWGLRWECAIECVQSALGISWGLFFCPVTVSDGLEIQKWQFWALKFGVWEPTNPGTVPFTFEVLYMISDSIWFHGLGYLENQQETRHSHFFFSVVVVVVVVVAAVAVAVACCFLQHVLRPWGGWKQQQVFVWSDNAVLTGRSWSGLEVLL